MNQITNLYLQFLKKIPQKAIHPIVVDWEKSMWHIYLQRKWTFIVMMVSESFQSFVTTLLPVAVGYIFSTQNPQLFIPLGALIIVLEIINRIIIWWFGHTEVEIKTGLKEAGLTKIIETDPIHHANKSTGASISKINNSVNSVIELIFVIVTDSVPIATTIITSVGALFIIDGISGILALGWMLLVLCILYPIVHINRKQLRPKLISAEDAVSALQNEAISQISYIRSMYQSGEVIDTYKYKNKIHNRIFLTISNSWGMSPLISRISFALLLIPVGYRMYGAVQAGVIDPTIVLGALVGLLSITNIVRRILNNILRMQAKYVRISDLFTYMREYGSTTYPSIKK